MMIGKTEVQCIVSNEINFQTFQILCDRFRIQKSFAGQFIFASGAPAVLPDITEGVSAEMIIFPSDLEMVLPLFLQLNRFGRIRFHSFDVPPAASRYCLFVNDFQRLRAVIRNTDLSSQLADNIVKCFCRRRFGPGENNR